MRNNTSYFSELSPFSKNGLKSSGGYWCGMKETCVSAPLLQTYLEHQKSHGDGIMSALAMGGGEQTS